MSSRAWSSGLPGWAYLCSYGPHQRRRAAARHGRPGGADGSWVTGDILRQNQGESSRPSAGWILLNGVIVAVRGGPTLSPPARSHWLARFGSLGDWPPGLSCPCHRKRHHSAHRCVADRHPSAQRPADTPPPGAKHIRRGVADAGLPAATESPEMLRGSRLAAPAAWALAVMISNPGGVAVHQPPVRRL